MKRAALVSLCLLLAGIARTQEPSAKDLRTLLHADVKSYANDGHLVATWPLKQPDELSAFETPDPQSVKILPGEGIGFSAVATKETYCTLKEVEFEPPCRIGFEIKLDGAESLFIVSLFDPAQPGDRVNVGLNAKMYRNSATRYDYIGRMKNASPEGQPSGSASTLNPGAWTPVTIDWRKDRVSLSFAKNERCVSDVSLKRFGAVFLAAGPKTLIRSLSIDSQVNRDSMRKLFRSVKASETSESPTESRAEGRHSAWAAIFKEMDAEKIDKGALAELQSLPSAAQELIKAGRDLLGKGDRSNEQAGEKFDRAIKLAPTFGAPLWFRGVAAKWAGEGGRAVEFLEKAVATNPDLHDAWICLAETRAERVQPEKALEALAKAEALDPGDPWVHAIRTRIHLEARRLEDARKEVEAGLAKRPESEGLKLLSAQLGRLTSHPDWKTTYPKNNGLFIVETSISSKVAADMAQKLLIYRHFLDEKFPIAAKQTTPSRVWVFDSSKEYHLFAALSSEDIHQSVGVYNRLSKTLLLTSKVSGETTQRILFHEAFHQYLDLVTGTAPIWLNEGLAEYYGATTFDVSNRATEGGILADRVPDLKHGRLVPVGDLMTMSQPAFMNPRAASLHYAESWALVHFFKQGGNPAYARLFAEYCAAVIMHKSQSDAFDSTFGKEGGPLDAIEREFRSYVTTRLLK